MILGVLSLWTRRSRVPIAADESEALDRDGARALNWALSRGARRTRKRLLWHAALLALVGAAEAVLHWTPAGVLAFVLLTAAAGVVIDALRVGFAHRWLVHAHGREYRAEQILQVALASEAGAVTRGAPGVRPQVLPTFTIAALLTAIGLPLAWFGFARLGWVGWGALFSNTFLPLLVIASSAIRLVLAAQEVRLARTVTVGSRELHLESDDALDAYAIAIVLAPPALLVGAKGALLIAFAIVAARAAWWAWRWWWLRRACGVLAERVYRTHPEARPRKARAAESSGEEL